MSRTEPLLREEEDGDAEVEIPREACKSFAPNLLGPSDFTGSNVSFSQEAEDTKEILAKEAAKSFFICLKDEAHHREQVEVLDYVLVRLQYRMQQVGDADGEHRTLQIYRRIAVELDRVQGLSFESVKLLGMAVDQIEALKPLPPADVVNRLVQRLGKITDKEVPGFGKTLYEYGDLWYTHKLEDKTTSESFVAKVLDDSVGSEISVKRELLVHKEAAREMAEADLEALLKEHEAYPICRWFVKIMLRSLRTRDNFTLFTYGWVLFPERHKAELPALRWAALGEELVAAVDTDCLSYADVRSVDLFGHEELQVEVLPLLTLQLTHLKALMHSNIKKSADFKSTMLAGAVTLGVTAGQLLVKYIL